MERQHLIVVCALLGVFMTCRAGVVAPSTDARVPGELSARLELLDFEADQVETFTPATNAANSVCMPRERYDSTIRVIERAKAYMKTVESYMAVCANLSNSIRDRSRN